jgi:hypothetical protein
MKSAYLEELLSIVMKSAYLEELLSIVMKSAYLEELLSIVMKSAYLEELLYRHEKCLFRRASGNLYFELKIPSSGMWRRVDLV